MPINADSKIILAKIEGTYGTDPTPTGSANAILTKGFSMRPIEGGSVQRDTDRPGHGNEQAILVNTHQVVEFGVELAGAGGAGDSPAYDPLLRACGLAATVSAGVDVQYDPVSTGFESAYMYFYHDGDFYQLAGCRGSWSYTIGKNEIPMINFTITGKYVAPAAGTDPTPDYSNFQEPLPVSNAETSFSIHGQSAVLHSLSIEARNTVTHRDLPNQANVIISGRDIGGDCEVEQEGLGTYNWPTKIKANTQGAMQVVHGTTAGNIVQIDHTLTQATTIQPGNQDGIATWQLGLICSPSDSGDDDAKITVK